MLHDRDHDHVPVGRRRSQRLYPRSMFVRHLGEHKRIDLLQRPPNTRESVILPPPSSGLRLSSSRCSLGFDPAATGTKSGKLLSMILPIPFFIDVVEYGCVGQLALVDLSCLSSREKTTDEAGPER